MATCLRAKSAGTPVTSLLTAASASAKRPFRVNHQGLIVSFVPMLHGSRTYDSGAIKIPKKMGIGQIH
jgi:hypothetical protein